MKVHKESLLLVLQTLISSGRPIALVNFRSEEWKPNLPMDNIVVIVCDSMDGRLLKGGRYEGIIDLPNLRTLAHRGVTFLNAYTNNPICVPSRSALWSGLHSHITESWNNYKGLPDDFNMSWADRLYREAGYDNKILGKVDFNSGRHSLSNRVEAWTRNVKFSLRQEARPTTKLTGTKETKKIKVEDWNIVENAVEFLKNRSVYNYDENHSPFLLYVGLQMPHPYSTPSGGEHSGDSTFKTSPYWLDKVSIGDIKLPKWLPMSEMHPADRYSTIVKNCSSQFTADELINIKAYFYAMCAETDAMVGEIITALDAYGFSNSTYIIFTSDHGELAMEHRQFYKMSMYEGSSHVPLVIAHPTRQRKKLGYGKGRINEHNERVIDTLVSLVDIYPTLMDIAKLNKPDYLNGTSLLPDKLSEHPGWILSQYHGCNVNASVYMLRAGPWKFITFDYGPCYIDPLLFNLDDDPDELQNLATTIPALVETFDKFLLQQVNYPSVTEKVKIYDKQSFLAWRKSEGNRYPEVILNLRWWMDWQQAPKENQQAIDDWLNDGIVASINGYQ